MIIIFLSGIHLEYIFFNELIAFFPESVSSPPIKTLSDLNRSFIAVPSAKNSGFDKTSNLVSNYFH